MDGQTHKAQFDGAQGDRLAAALELPSGTPRAFVLFAHCFSCSKDIHAARKIARALRGEGFAVLRFDFTGLGASAGDFANTNFSSNVEDLTSAADFLRREFEAPSIVIGHSLGGAAVIVAAATIPEVKAVAVIGAPSRADHVMMRIGEARQEIEKNGKATVSLAGRPFTIKKQFLDDLAGQNVLKAVAALKKPLLVMHAPRDAIVGIENAGEIFEAAKHPKSFISLDTADHLLSNTDDAHYAAGVLAAWAVRYVDHHPAPPESNAPVFMGGALAQSMKGQPLAVALSVDGHAVVSDASKEEGGASLGPNPTRLVEGALAACGVMTIKMYAKRKGWDPGEVTLAIRRSKGEDAHVSTHLEKELTMTGELDADQRARLLEIADKCPVHKMLSGGVLTTSRLG